MIVLVRGELIIKGRGQNRQTYLKVGRESHKRKTNLKV